MKYSKIALFSLLIAMQSISAMDTGSSSTPPSGPATESMDDKSQSQSKAELAASCCCCMILTPCIAASDGCDKAIKSGIASAKTTISFIQANRQDYGRQAFATWRTSGVQYAQKNVQELREQGTQFAQNRAQAARTKFSTFCASAVNKVPLISQMPSLKELQTFIPRMGKKSSTVSVETPVNGTLAGSLGYKKSE